jgi:uncharacterized damage-inducible protein DinB
MANTDEVNDMNAQELFGHWNDVRRGLIAALDKLTDTQLDFKPGEGLWSLRETIVHIAGTEDGWLRCYTANRWHEKPPQAAEYPTIETIKTLLAKEHSATEVQFAKDTETALAQVCTLPWGAQVTMGWAIWHVLEHEIHHRGEVYLMLGLMGIEAPDV